MNKRTNTDKVWVTTSQPLDLRWMTRAGGSPKAESREVVGPITIYLHHRGSRRAVGTMGGRKGMLTAFFYGLQDRIRDLKKRGLSPSRIAYDVRHIRPVIMGGAWVVPARFKKDRVFRSRVGWDLKRARESERYWDSIEDASSKDVEQSGVNWTPVAPPVAGVA